MTFLTDKALRSTNRTTHSTKDGAGASRAALFAA